MNKSVCKHVVCGLCLTFAAFANKMATAQLLDIFSDDEILANIGTAVGCDLSGRLKADMVANPLFELDGAQCSAVVPAETGSYYTDAACTNLIEFRKTGQQQFCTEALDKENLGQGDGNSNEQWTRSPGTAYDVGAATLDGLHQPYRTSVTFQTHDTARGQCRLEMRVYKNDLRDGQAQLKPMIALHGGSWSSRGFGTFGIESAVARYTAQGFVVFAPFYRLLGDREGGVCNGALLSQITADVERALDWVESNAHRYGAAGRPVVFGQSAGAHLALSLSVNHSGRVAGAVLLYPPTDFTDFVSMVRLGDYTNEEGLGILAKVLGQDAASYDLADSPVPENSFPAIVAGSPSSYPPMLIMHGQADELVPVRQSIRLCNALAGRELNQSVDNSSALHHRLECGLSSELHLFAQGNHALDICLSSDDLLSPACLSGSAVSRELVADQLRHSSRWAAGVSSPGNAGGGELSPATVIMLLMIFLVRFSPGSCTRLVRVYHNS